MNLDTQTIRGLLQNTTIFKSLTANEMDHIVDIANQRVYRRNSLVFMQGDTLTNVYFILRGKVKIYKTDTDGKEQIVNVLQSGDMFPHQGFFRQDDYPAHAAVMEEALLIYIPIKSFEDFIMNHPEISVKLFRVLGDIIMDLHHRLEEQVLHNTYEQIIMLLLRLSKSYGKQITIAQIQLTTQFTNQELANMIGSSRETISRTLTQLKRKGIIHAGESGFLVLHTNALQKELI